MFLSFLSVLQSLSLAAIAVAILLCLSALLIKRLLRFTGFSVYLCVILWTVSLCLWCGAKVYRCWGLLLLILGILFGGVGVVPVAFLCFLSGHSWRELFELLFQFALIVAGNLVAPWMLEQGYLLRRSAPTVTAGFRSRMAGPVTVRGNVHPIRMTATSPTLIRRWQKSRNRQ